MMLSSRRKCGYFIINPSYFACFENSSRSAAEKTFSPPFKWQIEYIFNYIQVLNFPQMRQHPWSNDDYDRKLPTYCLSLRFPRGRSPNCAIILPRISVIRVVEASERISWRNIRKVARQARILHETNVHLRNKLAGPGERSWRDRAIFAIPRGPSRWIIELVARWNLSN